MKCVNRPTVFLFGVSVALLVAVSVPLPALSAQNPDLACRSTIESGFRRWLAATMIARAQCQSRKILGRQDSLTDCVTGANDVALAARLAKADNRLDRSVSRRCANAEWGLLSYPGPCQDVAGPDFTADDLLRCMKNVGGAAIDAMFQVEYPPAMKAESRAYRSDEVACVIGTVSRSFAMLSRDMKTRFSCQLGQEAGNVDAGVDCRAIPVPYGPGTKDAAVDSGILRAYLTVLSGLPKACASIDIAALGYSAHCSDLSGGSFDFRDLESCVFDSNQVQLATLMDVVFPSDPVCGNGILQEGEECDDGRLNSDTVAGACRTDCRLPFCGDGTTDPGNAESCDDGNTTAGDGCDALCRTEFCGDGIVNGNPPEQCDDGNVNAADGCTNTCRFATCGDGVACTDSSCTSGPGGGPEQCDNGSGNAADGACHADCSGFRFTCSLTIGVTSSETLGALLYEMDYGTAAGELLGTAANVKCTSLVADSLFTFRDDDARRIMRESVINSAGFAGPASLADCSFATSDPGLAARAFKITVLDASSPDFDPLTPKLAVTAVDCTGQ